MASTKDEITAIAVEHGYTGKKPDSIAKAIDALADTLAGEDVTGSRSISGAVKALAPYIGSGGGGTTLGGVQYAPSLAFDRPAVGNIADITLFNVASLYVGNQQVLFSLDEGNPLPIRSRAIIPALAAGSRVTFAHAVEGEPSEVAAYVVKIGMQAGEEPAPVFESVELWDGEYAESYDDMLLSLTVTVPELDYANGEMLLFYFEQGGIG